MKFSCIRMVTMIFSLPLHIASVVDILSKVRLTSPFFSIPRKAWWVSSSFWNKRYFKWRSIKWDNERRWWLEVEENLFILSSHRIMAQIIIATNVYIQVYNCFIIGQILHVSNGSIFVENDFLFQKINMVEHIIHCFGSSCPLILFCLDYDSTKQMFKVKSVLKDLIVGF